MILRDIIPSSLDLNSIDITGASHAFTSHLNGNELQFTFSNIMLPWSDMDEDASQGWISFRIDQTTDLPVGTEIENTADIYFDFNDPIIKNTSLNTIVDSTINVQVIYDEIEFIVSPNPAEETATITWNKGPEKVQFELVNMMGKKVLAGQSAGRQISIARNKLASGFYQLRMMETKSEVGKASIRFR